MTELSIETRLLYYQIRQDVVLLHYQLSILLSLYRGTQHDERVLQKAGKFFYRVLYNDLCDAIILNFARLLDPAKQGANYSASLERLIDDVEGVDPKLADQLTQCLDTLRCSYPEFDHWRDKWAAHRDYKAMTVVQTPEPWRTPEQHDICPKFNPERLKDVLKELDSFMNTFESRFEDKRIVIMDASYDDQMIAQHQIPSPTSYDAFDATDDIKKLTALLDVPEFG